MHPLPPLPALARICIRSTKGTGPDGLVCFCLREFLEWAVGSMEIFCPGRMSGWVEKQLARRKGRCDCFGVDKGALGEALCAAATSCLVLQCIAM